MRFYFLSQEGRLNKERYSDPTAEKAIAHVMRERKKQEGDNLVKKQSERKGKGSQETI